jgi:HSP20 family protein
MFTISTPRPSLVCNPFTAFDALERSLEPSLAGIARPACEIQDNAENYTVLIDLPGVKKADIKISLEAGLLTVIAQRGKQSLEQILRLSEEVDQDHVQAAHEDGVLTLTLGKHRKALARQIEIQ